jgi:hypothetical protein
MRIFFIGWLGFVACSEDTSLGSGNSGVGVVDTYEREFSFATPLPCKLFLHRRVTDEKARVVEYDARVGNSERSVVYSIVANDAYPLRADVYDGMGVRKFTVEADDHDLQVQVGDRTALVVTNYDGSAATTKTQLLAGIEDPDGLALLACALPIRTELGPVPAFLLNRASGGRDPNEPDLAHQSSDVQPILGWTGHVSILGAFKLEGACLEESGWQCPCLRGRDTLVGPTAGWCIPAGSR